MMPGRLMLVMLTCVVLNDMPWAADAGDAQMHGVECDAWVADAGDAHVRCVECDALGG